jgi:hypothetical protein
LINAITTTATIAKPRIFPADCPALQASLDLSTYATTAVSPALVMALGGAKTTFALIGILDAGFTRSVYLFVPWIALPLSRIGQRPIKAATA